MNLSGYTLFQGKLEDLGSSKLLITTLNAHSYNLSRIDEFFSLALSSSDVIIPDGVSVVWANKLLTGKNLRKIAGEDLFKYEMNRLQIIGGKCLFLGSSDLVLEKIKERAVWDYPKIQVRTYSPPFKSQFSDLDNAEMLGVINEFKPDVLFVGMTAPKQEKWAFEQKANLEVGHICCIGAVFDFYAGTVNRAPNWMIRIGLEWFYRLYKEPKRMWKRYLIGNVKFLYFVLLEKLRNR